MKRDWIIEKLTELSDESTAIEIIAFLEAEGLLNVEFGNEEVTTVIEEFKKWFGTTKATKWDRFAAKRLVNKHGVPAVLRVIEALCSQSGHKYAPTVNSVSQLEEKWPGTIKFLQGQVPQEAREL